MASKYVHPIEEVKCPMCGHVMTATLIPGVLEDPKPPNPGDWSFCTQCGDVSIFETSTKTRSLTKEERDEINQDAELQYIMSTLRKTNAGRN